MPGGELVGGTTSKNFRRARMGAWPRVNNGRVLPSARGCWRRRTGGTTRPSVGFDEEQLLRNLVRLRYNETPLELNVSSIAAQYELDGGAEARPFFRPESHRQHLPDVHQDPAGRECQRREPADHHPRAGQQRRCGPAIPHPDHGRHAHLSLPDELAGVDRDATLDRADQRGPERRLGQWTAARRSPRLRPVPAGGGVAPDGPAPQAGHVQPEEHRSVGCPCRRRR